METKTTEKAVMNVGFLDLRNVTQESWSQVGWIQNVGTIVCAGDPANLLAGRTMLNTGSVFQAPADVELKLIQAPISFTQGYFEGCENPATVVVLSPVVFAPDVTPQDVEKGIAGLIIASSLTCPEHLLDTLQSKIHSITGSVRTYRCPPSTPFTQGTLVLDEDYLHELKDGSEFAVLGKLRLPRVLPNELLERKVCKLYVTGRVMCHEENRQVIEDRLADPPKGIKTIPLGFEWVKKPLTLDNTALESLPGKKLYCTGRVRVDPDVDPAVLDARLESLICEDVVLCPAALKGTMSRKSDWFVTRSIFYDGELWVVDDERDLLAYGFETLEGKATLVVFGELRVDPEIEPQTLGDGLAKVHNLGVIWCTPEQKDAIQARLGLRDGELLDSTQTDEEPLYATVPADYEIIGNSGYLVL